MSLNRRHWLVIILAVSALTHFAFFGYPKSTVFDEVHFGKFISAYYTGEYYFDIHPPLGKLILAGFGKLFDFRPEFSFASIGDKFPDNKYLALRFLPSLAGTLLAIVIFLLALELGFKRRVAIFAGLATALDGALLVQSRLILLDAFLLLFGFTALLLYFRYRNNRSWRNLVGAGIFASLAVSIKWTGASFLALILILETVDLVRTGNFLQYLWQKLLSLIAIPFVLYALIFAIHFYLLPKTGQGDAFMSMAFQKTLSGNNLSVDNSIKPAEFWHKFYELNVQMYLSNQRLTAGHPYSSAWYTWPTIKRPIYYWIGETTEGAAGRIYLIGNIATWWLSSLAVLAALLFVAYHGMKQNTKLTILLAAYILNLLPFIGIHRAMFLYHYFIALIFAILILAYLIDISFSNSKSILTGLLAVILLVFVLFSPLTYGLKLTSAQYERLMWFGSWK